MLVSILNLRTHATTPYCTLIPWVTIAPMSLIWQEYWAQIGSAQVVFAADDITKTITPGMFLHVQKSDTLMFIMRVQVHETAVQVFAQDIKTLLLKKSMRKLETSGTVNVKNKILSVMANEGALLFLDQNTMTMYNAPSENIDALEYSNVYDFVQNCLTLSKGGFMLRYIFSTGLVQFEATQGRDLRSTIIFSPVLGNIANAVLVRDNTADYNKLTVLGEDSSNNEVVVVVEREGLTEYDEIYRAVLDVKSELRQTKETLSEYKSALRARGRKELAKLKTKTMVTGVSVGASGAIPGDIVTVHNGGRGGASTQAIRVVGKSIAYENGIDKVTLIFDQDAEDVEPET